MTKNPLINALTASLYITAVASTMFYGSKFVGENEPTVFIPIAMISLLTISVAIMGFIFFYQPFQMYFAGEKKSAINLFLKTIVIFACITALIFFIAFFGNFNL